MLMAATFLFWSATGAGGRLLRDELSPISRQHIDLYQGVQLSESAVESAKARFRDLLERGEVEAVEASLRAGMQYVVQVRALAELGTDDAGRILERQLQRRLTDDAIEQAWYWIDLANGLRSLNRAQSLPHLLRCAESAGDLPLGHFFAAETICFLGFAGYLRRRRHAARPRRPARAAPRPGRAAFRRPADAGGGGPRRRDDRDALGRPAKAGRSAGGARLRRGAARAAAGAARRIGPGRRGVGTGGVRLADVAPGGPGSRSWRNTWRTRRRSWRPGCRGPRRAEQRDLLLALIDLRAETAAGRAAAAGAAAFPARRIGPGKPGLVVRPARRAGPARNGLPTRAGAAAQPAAPFRPAAAAAVRAAGLPVSVAPAGPARQSRPRRRKTFCCWPPATGTRPTARPRSAVSAGGSRVQRAAVLLTLQDARRDPNPDVRQAARAALARLGERQALQWFRQTLTSEDPQRVHEAIQAVAVEGLTLLWPDLDRLADAEDPDVSQHAREALERLCEDMDFGRRR